MNSLLNLGQDLGFGANKLFGQHGNSILQSIIAADTGHEVTQSMGLRISKKPLRIGFNGVSYYVGPNSHDWGSPIENLDYERMQGIPETRAILYGNLTSYIKAYQPEFLENTFMVVGLPLDVLSGPHANNNADRIRKWITGVHEWEADGQKYSINIQETRIASQPSGALFDYLFDDEGQLIQSRKNDYLGEIGIISIGFNTIEILTVKEKMLVQNSTMGKSLGVRRLLEMHNDHSSYTMGELDSKLRAGRLDVSHLLPVWQSQIIGVVDEAWGKKWSRFSKIILVGGGAKLIGMNLLDFFKGNAIIPDDPVISISRGLYKYAMSLNKKKGE